MSEDFAIKLLVIGGGMVFVLLLVAVSALKDVAKTRTKERTRREVAAYVAEGSIRPEDATLLLSAGTESDVEKQIADGVAWGVISTEKAENLIAALRSDGKAKRPAQG